MKHVKYGLYCYNTENIGDEIQSIAARRFLPRVDYYFDRDDIDSTKTNKNEDIKLIMYGWYSHKPGNWPPKNKNIKPLLISMFVNQIKGPTYSVDAFSSLKSIDFLNNFGPVGARDEATLKLFKNIGVESYFSGCVTLTIKADTRIKKQNFILAVDVSDRIYNKITKQTKRNVICLNTCHLNNLSSDEKFKLAEYWLMLYQSAHMVVTTRLHCMLPCLALETPVIAISGHDKARFSGLIDLTNNITEQDFLDDKFSYDFEHPKHNPDTYKAIRDSLVKTCAKYTGFDSNGSYISYTSPENLINDPSLLNALGKSVFSGYELDRLKEKEKQLQNEINALSNQVERLTSVKGAAKQFITVSKVFVKKKLKF